MRGWEEIVESLQRSGSEPPPHPFPELAPVFAALARMGRDANGSLLHSERTDWLDENGVKNAEEREQFHRLFDAADAEHALYAAERREELERKMQRR